MRFDIITVFEVNRWVFKEVLDDNNDENDYDRTGAFKAIESGSNADDTHKVPRLEYNCYYSKPKPKI